MLFKKIAVLDTGYDSYSYEEKLLSGAGYNLEIFPGGRNDRHGKMKFSKDAVGLFVRWTQINDEFLQRVISYQFIAILQMKQPVLSIKIISG